MLAAVMALVCSTFDAHAAEPAGMPGRSAGSVRMPTQAEMDRQRHRMPSDAELARQPAPVMPRLGAADTPMQPGIDAGALAAQYEAMHQAREPEGESQMSGLLIFVTLAMPRVSLQRLVEQAERSRATLVLRGLKDRSMKDTLAVVAGLIGQRKVAWMIDPESFKRYGVDLAPSFVLVAPQSGPVPGCTSGQCAIEPAYSKVVGDVSTSFALQTIEREDTMFRAQAVAYRQRLERRR